MKFYEIDEMIDAALAELVDEDGVINEKAEAYLDSLEIALEQKTEGVLLAIKGLKAEAEAIRNEEKALADRRHGLEKKADGLTEFIKGRLAGEKFKTPRVAVSYRKTTSVEVEDGVWMFWPVKVQDECTKVNVTVDKPALKKLLTAGNEIQGARLVEGQSMTIK